MIQHLFLNEIIFGEFYLRAISAPVVVLKQLAFFHQLFTYQQMYRYFGIPINPAPNKGDRSARMYIDKVQKRGTILRKYLDTIIVSVELKSGKTKNMTLEDYVKFDKNKESILLVFQGRSHQ